MKHTFSCGALGALALLLAVGPALADSHAGQSLDVVIIGGTALELSNPCGYGNYANVMYSTYGGCLPVTGPAGELGDFNFSAMAPSAVSAASLAPYDTAVLNVASVAMACNTNTLSPQQQADLIAFVGNGKKLIIFDSECWPGPVDYSWMPFPFVTANPGAMGAQGLLTIVEENTLCTSVAADTHYIDCYDLSYNTDAVGDMNVMTTLDPNWCVDMSGTNYLQVTGPVHTYAKYPAGTDHGLIIYNGLDQDYLWYNNANLRKLWVQELQQPFNPSGLPCGITVVGITLEPISDVNYVGEDHTVTAVLTDLLGNPQPGIVVTFSVSTGPNAGASGVCTVHADCSTDAAGAVSFTYTGVGGMGVDEIVACFFNEAGEEVCSQAAIKEWLALPVPVDVKPTSCRNPFNAGSSGKLPVAVLGTADFDVYAVDPASVQLMGVDPLRWSYEDVATPFVPYLGKSDAFDCTEEGPDGFLDLTLKYGRQAVLSAIEADLGREVADGEVLVLSLDGLLADGTVILGEDVVVILKK